MLNRERDQLDLDPWILRDEKRGKVLDKIEYKKIDAYPFLHDIGHSGSNKGVSLKEIISELQLPDASILDPDNKLEGQIKLPVSPKREKVLEWAHRYRNLVAGNVTGIQKEVGLYQLVADKREIEVLAEVLKALGQGDFVNNIHIASKLRGLRRP